MRRLKDPVALEAMPGTKRKLLASRAGASALDQQMQFARTFEEAGTLEQHPELKQKFEKSRDQQMKRAHALAASGTLEQHPELKQKFEESHGDVMSRMRCSF